ncbi:8434_t:CDS:10 [Ambispora leptoticha]|uniref:8434_t:CDS:1 n=1 Tax=Ambispora leptoticha TaxID=144679 RepID=A0A9N9AC53_9GLOM|nr:8434_t:CDS:10 [Ambispora leptoticha]
MSDSDIRAVVAIDFGTTFSGFAFAHKANSEIETNNRWIGREGLPKTNTALRYDSNFVVTAWGEPALVDGPEKKKKSKDANQIYTVEMFKLHLTEMSKKAKPPLPPNMSFKRPISDYLLEMDKLIQETIEKTWPGIRKEQVLYVMTIPAEWREYTKGIMRECAHEAGIISSVESTNLEFTSEPEAAAMHCLKVIEEHNLKPGDSFLVVDCGGGTVDLTTRRLRGDGSLDEITERTGDLCGSTFVDREFLKWLGRKLGESAMENVKNNHYGNLQYLIQKFFCPRVKFLFDGDPLNFKNQDVDIEHWCPAFLKYVTGDAREQMEEEDWLIELDFNAVKEMFDPVVKKVLKLITDQLKAAADVQRPSAMFLVGGFSESKYLRKRIREEFLNQVPIIAEPRQPMAAVVKGAVAYGLKMETVNTRVLKWSYGIEILGKWQPGVDPKKRRTQDGRIYRFNRLAERRKPVEVNKEFTGEFKPVYPNQTSVIFKVFYTKRNWVRFCDDPGVRFLDLPDVHLGINRPIEFGLTFGKMELKATARNKTTGQIYQTSWRLRNFAA